MILSCPLKFKGRVPTSFGVALYTWVGLLYLGSTLLSSGGAISWGAHPVSVCAPSWLVRFPREDFPGRTNIDYLCSEIWLRGEHWESQHSVHKLSFDPLLRIFSRGWYPPSPMPAAHQSREPVWPSLQKHQQLLLRLRKETAQLRELGWGLRLLLLRQALN